jgi:prophage antirepressor-like protein
VTYPITTVEFKGRPIFFVDELAEALGYAGKGNLADLLRREWAEEVEEGVEILVVTNGDIRTLQKLREANDSVRQTESCGDDVGEEPTRGGARKLIVLTEAGVHLVCIKTEKPAGKRLRRWLAREVLPAIRRTGGYQAPGAAPAPVDPTFEERLRRLEATLARPRALPAPSPEQVEARRRKVRATTIRREATRALNLRLITHDEWLARRKLADQVAAGEPPPTK